MADNKVSLKLLVDTKKNKVLFAEAGKEFVDFLFHLSSLPIATLIKLLNPTNMVGCLGKLYTSIESSSSDDTLTNAGKELTLNPKTRLNIPLLSLSDAPTSHQDNNFFCCSKSLTHPIIYEWDDHYPDVNRYLCESEYVSNDPSAICPGCKSVMSTKLAYVAPKGSTDVEMEIATGGYLKGVVTYMVMDHLEVHPMTTFSGITLINELGVKDISSLLEKQVQVTLSEAVAIVKASFETQAVLSTVFLGNEK